MIKKAIIKAVRSTTLGLLLALLVGGPLCQPASAQFGGIVHDPASLAAHVRKWAEELNRWLETVNHYAQTVERMTEQVTNLKGILKTVEKQIGFSRKMLQTISDIGKTIRAAYRIRTLMEGIVRGRMRSIARIHDRLARGLFDPGRDAADLKEYLSWELGQVSERTLGDIERLEEYDSQLQMLKLELDLRKKRIADAEKASERVDELLEQMRANPEEVTQLDVQQAQLEADQRNYQAQLARDREQMIALQREELKRRERIGKDVIESRRFGKQIDDLNGAWTKMTVELNKLRINPLGNENR
jgi:archaellum component FlaC